MDIVTLYLRDVLGEGCPVCRSMWKYEDSEMETILYEHVNDPELRCEFRKSLGLCTHHAWKLLQKAYSDPLLGPLGVAIIYSDMLSTYVEYLERGKTPDEGKCLLCNLLEVKERNTVDAFVERIDDLLPEYERSGSVLCRRHYEMILGKLKKKNPEKAKKLREVQLRKLKSLGEKLESFIDKFDYRAESEHTKEEIKSLPLTIEALKGLDMGQREKALKGSVRGLRWIGLRFR